MGKSEMVFSPHIDTATKLNFQANLLIPITSSIPKYLGLPTHFGKNSKGGKRDTYLLKVEVFLLEQWPRLSQLMSRVVSYYLYPYVKILKEQFVISSGKALITLEKFTGPLRLSYSNLKKKGVWDSKFSGTLIWPCLLSKSGGFILILTLF